MNHQEKLSTIVIQEVKRRMIDEAFPRVLQCLDKLTEEQIWARPNPSSNSIGNIILHLEGNVRQYIMHGIAGEADIRERAMEFSTEGPIQTSILKKQMTTLFKAVEIVLHQLTEEDLTRPVSVQGFDETVASILLHVTEHFSGHAGQIFYFTKYVTRQDLGFWNDLNLDITG